MITRCNKKITHKVLNHASGGFSLVEVVIAIVVLAFLVGSIPAAMIAVSNAHFKANEMRMAELLTRNEFEYIKSQEYKPGNVTYPVQYKLVNVDTTGFGFHVDAWPIDPETGERIGNSTFGNITLYDHDYGIQLITVSVYGFQKRYGEPGVKPLLVSTNYKVDRRLSQ